jgi:hypothetical protein
LGKNPCKTSKNLGWAQILKREGENKIHICFSKRCNHGMPNTISTNVGQLWRK